jgi:hypothetical protein
MIVPQAAASRALRYAGATNNQFRAGSDPESGRIVTVATLADSEAALAPASAGLTGRLRRLRTGHAGGPNAGPLN